MVRAPVRTGFGTRLISMGIAGTRGAELSYAPSGLRARFEAPLAALTD